MSLPSLFKEMRTEPSGDRLLAARADAGGPIRTVRKRREKAGTYSAAQKLLAKRHTQKLEGKKLPENLRTMPVTFRELCDDALVHSQSENGEKQTYDSGCGSINSLPNSVREPWSRSRRATSSDGWRNSLRARDWAASSRNRWQATFSLIFRVGIDNEKIDRNPRPVFAARRRLEGASDSCQTRKRFVCAPPSSTRFGSSCLIFFCLSIR